MSFEICISQVNQKKISSWSGYVEKQAQNYVRSLGVNQVMKALKALSSLHLVHTKCELLMLLRLSFFLTFVLYAELWLFANISKVQVRTGMSPVFV